MNFTFDDLQSISAYVLTRTKSPVCCTDAIHLSKAVLSVVVLNSIGSNIWSS